jgi:hypothetical protein
VAYNLPTGQGILICDPRSIQIVKLDGKDPIDGGAGKIKICDSEIFDQARRMGIKPNWKNLEADWIITSDSLYYINPFIKATYEFKFSEYNLSFGRNRGYGFNKMMGAVNIINKENKNDVYILKTNNSAQTNISYIFTKYEN